jgi:hypothetical protein
MAKDLINCSLPWAGVKWDRTWYLRTTDKISTINWRPKAVFICPAWRKIAFTRVSISIIYVCTYIVHFVEGMSPAYKRTHKHVQYVQVRLDCMLQNLNINLHELRNLEINLVKKKFTSGKLCLIYFALVKIIRKVSWLSLGSIAAVQIYSLGVIHIWSV